MSADLLITILVGLAGPALVAIMVWKDPHGEYSRKLRLHDLMQKRKEW